MKNFNPFLNSIFFPILGQNELDCSLIMDSGDAIYTDFDFEDQVIFCIYAFSLDSFLVYVHTVL